MSYFKNQKVFKDCPYPENVQTFYEEGHEFYGG